MGGWRPTKHNYKNRTYINAFFHQRKLRMWVDGALLNANANINVFFHQRKLKMWGGGWRPTKHKCKYRTHINVFGGQLYHRLVK